MAKVKKNPLVRGLSGKFGDQVMFRQLRDGQTIVCARPDFSKRVLSAEQKAHHEKFRAGAAYAKAAAKTQPLYAQLAAGTMKTAYNVALADYFHAPVIQRVDIAASGVIRVAAHDDVRVAGVRVIILDDEGKEVEKGEGIRGEGDQWEYFPTAMGKVIVEARDLAGNVVRMEKSN